MIDSKHDEIWGLVIGNVVCLEGKMNQKWGRDQVTAYRLDSKTLATRSTGLDVKRTESKATH